jgi:hypothetical protein
MGSEILTAILLVLNIVVILGGGGYFIGKLGTKLDHLSTAIEQLTIRLDILGVRVTDHESRLSRLEGSHEEAR